MLLFLILIFVILFGCQSTSKTQKPELHQDNITLLLDSKITEVIISDSSKSTVTASENEDYIESFRSILSSAVKEDGIANMSNPDYIVDVVYGNESEQRFDLWIDQTSQRTTLMNTDDTHTIYTLSKEMTDKLILLVGEPLLKSKNY